ncbi:hypothetical protein L226DRAFT_615407 [Lentinus tigrinus ALCF2SS1-7]|uniref:RNA polymerase II-associated protein 1 C-terminal domain-containing protein n=1 Tax=Lentinus tigrinus ALCF2SS1-6 TaxID=1328759 RepID=A0A5C2S002_9APHY|nr:hypothetical protein L227DRAFT_655996 [Lentinus tigrinus ALCF2SS1-6]RPD71662.1 hypothetical protein L226DRAFT_615407 [Lentinus tigrinus ALCF2SS1-7]
MSQSSLVGSIFERKPVAKPIAPSAPTTNTGFPAVKHRSQSAFARARATGSAKRAQQVPTVQSSAPPRKDASQSSVPEDWRAQVEEDNRRRVEAMTEEEREQERAEILEKFGPGIADVLRRARATREANQRSGGEKVGLEPSAFSSPHQPRGEVGEIGSRSPSPESTPRPRLGERTPSFTSVFPPRASPPTSTSSTRPSSRSERRIRFAELTPDDIHVYESAPPSPRKRALALPPPSDADGPTISLGRWKSTALSRINSSDPTPDAEKGEPSEQVGDLEEGTPEDIRRRFFPTAPPNDPSLEWIQGDAEPEEEATPTVRFDLSGTPISAKLSASLPTHLGLHHHAEGSHAGYTLEDIFMLSRSTVPAQRATMLGVLAKVAHRLARTSTDSKKSIPELAGQEIALRKRMLAAGVEALSERASVGARAVELLWECTAQWDEEVLGLEGVELADLDKGDALASLPLDYLLPQISTVIELAELPNESLSQLLAILHRLVQHSNANATAIVSSKGLVANVLQRFLLTPIPPAPDGPRPSPLALKFMRTLIQSSRENAKSLVGPADSLLRFVITLPSASPFPVSLATQLLAETLHLYADLASYGLYSHVTTTAQEYFMQLNQYIRSPQCRNSQLRSAWLRALEAWTVCARDPHSTTPSHDILWSQVVGWGWVEDMLEVRKHLDDTDGEAWSHLWSSMAAFLEGAKVNGARGGEDERAMVLEAIKDGFVNGREKRIVGNALRSGQDISNKLGAGMRQGILPSDVPSLRDLGTHASTIAAAIRLFLACTPGSHKDIPDTPPFLLPFADISSACAAITTSPLWTSLYTPESIPYGHLFYRPLSTLLSSYLQLSRKTPGTSPDLWMAQSLAILCRHFPGDDERAQQTASQVAETITSDFLRGRGWSVPDEIWDRGGMGTIVPFLTHSLQPKGEEGVGPLWITPKSISTATTQRLPPFSSLQPNDRRHQPLPLTKDWVFCPLDHLLRSGESEAFKDLPSEWDASEVEVVRATLLFIRVSQEVLHYHHLDSFVMTREEVMFGCMKVFMLEHGQQQDDSSDEVFRDGIVERYMSEILAPFTASADAKTLRTPPPSIHTTDSLDVVAKRFLGATVPFYQWYTDFVGLYDSISFAHPLFARLLLPPLNMRYPSDYRKYLWVDYNHVMRTVRTPPGDAITGSIAEYLWPVETDAEIVGAYLRALVKGPLEGFVRLIAVHHVACKIWPDMGSGSDGEDKAVKLLKALVDQGGFDAIRDVVLYRQHREGTIVLPPACFQEEGSWKGLRLEFAGKCGEDVKERLKNLLDESK